MKCECGAELRKTTTRFKGLEFQALGCSKCKKKYFDESMAGEVALKLEAQRLKKQYVKSPVRIGHSWGIILPKELADFFQMNARDAKIVMKRNIEEGRIELKSQ